MTSERDWFCISTQVGREPAAASRLSSRHIEVLTPKYLYRRPNGHGGFNKPVDRSYFPGYFFAFCSIGEYQLAAYGMPKAILRMVTLASAPHRVPEWMIAEVCRRMSCDGYIETADEQAARVELKHGQAVKIIAGPYKDFDGLFDRDEKKRVIVLVQMFGQLREVPMKREWLRPAQAMVM